MPVKSVLGRGGRDMLLHGQAIAAVVVLDSRHVGLHQGQAAAARNLETVGRSAIGHGGWIEADAFVGDLDPEPRRTEPALDLYPLFRIFLVAVANSVGDRLLERHANREEIFLLPTK